MNGRLRLLLCGACVAIGVFHAPTSTHVLHQDLTGPYDSLVRVISKASDARVTVAIVPKGSESFDGAHDVVGTRRSKERR